MNTRGRQVWTILRHRQWIDGWDALKRFELNDCTSRRGLPVHVESSNSQPGLEIDATPDCVDDAIEAYAIVIVGEAGTGKTWLVNEFKRQEHLRSDFSNPDADVRPVVQIVVPDPPTPKGIVTEICTKLHSVPLSSWSLRRISAHLSELLKDLKVQFILMDEAHVLVDRLSENKVAEITRFLKFLLVECNVPIILAGEEPIRGLLDPRHKALKRRMVAPIELQAYGWGDIEDSADFMAMAGEIAAGLGYSEWSEFGDIELAARLYYESRGIIGLLVKQIREASEPDPKVVEQYQHVMIHAVLARDGVINGMDWHCSR